MTNHIMGSPIKLQGGGGEGGAGVFAVDKLFILTRLLKIKCLNF